MAGPPAPTRPSRKSRAQEEAALLAHVVYAVTHTFPASERAAIGDQMRRAAVSVVSNIAEAGARASRTDRARLLAIAWGSLRELEAQAELATAAGLAAAPLLARLTLGCRHTGGLLHALRNSQLV